MRKLVGVCVLVSAALAGCVLDVTDVTDVSSSPVPPATTAVPSPGAAVAAPAAPAPPAQPFVPALDPQGRPYDVPFEPGSTVERRRVASLATAGRPLTLDGGENFLFDGATALPLPPSRTLDLDLVLAAQPGASPSVAGVVLQVPGSSVAAWGRFEDGYGTDGGTGAFWVVTAGADDGDVERVQAMSGQALDRLYADEDWVLVDSDDDGADDSLLFGNGWGDGAFPLTVGTDARGRAVAVTIWHRWAPWRLGVPEVAPPPDVTEAEDLVVDCLAGGGTPLYDGTCSD